MANTTVLSQTLTLQMAISPISKLTETWSPEVSVHGIPWKVQITKNEEQNSLAAHLYCTNEDDSSNWAVPACATVKLIPFSQTKSTYVRHVAPFVFRPSELSIGESSVIPWDELMKEQNKYVQNDTIQLKIKVIVEDPNNVNRSILKFKRSDESCNCGSLATFQLTVKNIGRLLAVCSAPFTVCDLSWQLTVFKSQTSKLGITLDLIDQTEEVSCKMKMWVKLLSRKSDVDPIKRIVEKQVETSGNFSIDDTLSWEDLFKPDKGFVNNNSITLEVKLKTEKPDGASVPDADPRNAVAAKRERLECSICLKSISGQSISTTIPCGHLFCTVCITKAIKNRRISPVCKNAVKTLQSINLPISK